MRWVSVTPRPALPDDPEPEVRWLVIRADGTLGGVVDLAAAERPRFLDATHLVTTWRGDLNIERVWVYALLPALTDEP